jgi:hypothetical protein
MSTDPLEQLRAKTDRQLLLILRRQVEHCLDHPLVPADRAERCYLFAATVIPTMHHITRQERTLLESQLEMLRRLAEVGGGGMTRLHFDSVRC